MGVPAALGVNGVYRGEGGESTPRCSMCNATSHGENSNCPKRAMRIMRPRVQCKRKHRGTLKEMRAFEHLPYTADGKGRTAKVEYCQQCCNEEE